MKDFTAKDIVSIIAACHKNQVKNIKLNGLEIDFAKDGDELQPQVVGDVGGFAPPQMNIEDFVKAERAEDEIADDIHKMNLLASDPAAYEALMLQEHNEDAVRHRETKQPL